MKLRLINADAYAAKMKDRQSACREWVEEAKEEGDEAQTARARQAYAAFVEAKLTMDAMPTIDAIPVEWLNWRIEHAKREGFDEIAHMLKMVRYWWNDQRELWQEERGAKMDKEENE